MNIRLIVYQQTLHKNYCDDRLVSLSLCRRVFIRKLDFGGFLFVPFPFENVNTRQVSN